MWWFSILLALWELDKWMTVESADSFWGFSSKNNTQFCIRFYGITVQVFDIIFHFFPIGRQVPTILLPLGTVILSGDLQTLQFPWINLLLVQKHCKFTWQKCTLIWLIFWRKKTQEIAERKELILSDLLRKAIISSPLFILTPSFYFLFPLMHRELLLIVHQVTLILLTVHGSAIIIKDINNREWSEEAPSHILLMEYL